MYMYLLKCTLLKSYMVILYIAYSVTGHTSHHMVIYSVMVKNTSNNRDIY